MRSRAGQIFPVLLMLGLALGTLWLERLVQLPPIASKGDLRHDPDFIVEHFTLTRMNALGHPESSLTAPKMLHYPDDETTVLERPRYRQHPTDKPTIEIVADRGTVSKDGEVVWLEGNVVVTRAPAKERAAMQMTTTALEIELKTEIARTDEPVLITEEQSTLRGVGMVVNGKSREFELKSRVQGSFPPNPK
jgi:lipopolysaccharide export system protein LptC